MVSVYDRKSQKVSRLHNVTVPLYLRHVKSGYICIPLIETLTARRVRRMRARDRRGD